MRVVEVTTVATQENPELHLFDFFDGGGDFLGFLDGDLDLVLDHVGVGFGLLHVFRLHRQDFAHFVRRLGRLLHLVQSHRKLVLHQPQLRPPLVVQFLFTPKKIIMF